MNKYYLNLFTIGMTLISSAPVWALHSYHDEVCRTQFQGQALYLSKAGSLFGLNGGYIELSNPMPTDAELVTKIIKNEIQTTVPYNDGCWIGTTGTIDRDISIEYISEKASESTKLKTGMQLNFNCEYFYADPIGNCD